MCKVIFFLLNFRRSKLLTEPPYCNGQNPNYTIFCEKHAPLKVKKTLEGKVKNYVDEISKFVQAIEKFYQSYRFKFDEVADSEHKNLNYIKALKKIYKKELKKPEVAKSILDNAKNPVKALKEILEPEPKISPSKKQLQIPFITDVSKEIAKFPEFGNIWVLKQTKKAPQEDPANIQKGTIMSFIKQKDGYQFLEYKKPKKEFLKNVVPKNHDIWSILATKKNLRAKPLYRKYKRITECLKSPELKTEEMDKLESKFKTKCLVSIKKTGINSKSDKNGQKPYKIPEKTKLKKILNIKLKKKHENAKIRRIEKMVADELKESLLDKLNEKLQVSNLQLKNYNTKSNKESVNKIPIKKIDAEEHTMQNFNTAENCQENLKDQIAIEIPSASFQDNLHEEFTDEPQCICQLPWRGELLVECEECHEWFHPNCLGIVEMDENKLNDMFINCTDCAKKLNKNKVIDQEHVPEDVKKNEQPCENLAKRTIEDLTANPDFDEGLEVLKKLHVQDLTFETNSSLEILNEKALLENRSNIISERRFEREPPKSYYKASQNEDLNKKKKVSGHNISLGADGEFLFDARHLPKKVYMPNTNSPSKSKTKASPSKSQEYYEDLKKISSEALENKSSCSKNEIQSKNMFCNAQQLKSKNSSITSFFITKKS